MLESIELGMLLVLGIGVCIVCYGMATHGR